MDAIVHTKHGIQLNVLQGNKNPFLELRKATKDAKIKNIQFKILHNVYPTMKHLFKWKIKINPNCTLCGEPETLEHAIFNCPVASDCWNKLFSLLKINTTSLTYRNILLGLSSNHCPSREVINIFCEYRVSMYPIDVIMILLKQALILQREEKRFLSINEIKCIIRNRLNIEKYIHVKANSVNSYEKKWLWIENMVRLT